MAATFSSHSHPITVASTVEVGLFGNMLLEQKHTDVVPEEEIDSWLQDALRRRWL
jgi:hypothetical protein